MDSVSLNLARLLNFVGEKKIKMEHSQAFNQTENVPTTLYSLNESFSFSNKGCSPVLLENLALEQLRK